jgi:hypothetical protein
MRISLKSVRTIVAGVLLSQGATALAQDVDFQRAPRDAFESLAALANRASLTEPLPAESAELEAIPTEFSEAALEQPTYGAAPPKPAAAPKKKKPAGPPPAATAYKGVFYDNDFTYLTKPGNKDWYPGDSLKRIPVADGWKLDMGGQYRLREHSERQMRGFGLTGVNDDFLLERTRLFANLQGENVRIYAEGIDAQTSFQRAPSRIIEQNPADLLNLFADAKLWDGFDGDTVLRVGRQELLYGSERLISPLDWANTRRTFEGAKVFFKNKDWNLDAFYTRPVLVDPHALDGADYHQEFSGFWATNKSRKNQTLDLYYIAYRNGSGFLKVNGTTTNNYQFQTVGSRWTGSQDAWLWDFEGGAQYGTNTDRTAHMAGFWTLGGGYKFDDYKWKPTLWGYYDWASGSNAQGQGNGFNQLFPLGHKYLGFMDLYGRNNIETPNILLTMQPHKKLQFLAWYYYFFLTSGYDTPYNVNSVAFHPTSAPGSRDLGHEIDTIFTYTINPRQTLLFGYSHFFAGQYYRTTPGLPTSNDGDFFYTQYQVNF